MAWTQEDIDKLKAAIATGVLTVVYDGPPRRQVTYQSTDSMLKALGAMQGEVDATAGTSSVIRTAYNRGFNRQGSRGRFRRNE